MKISRCESEEQDYWLSDEKGLRLLVKTSGKKYWRMKYRFAGKQKTLALGVYPDVSLKDARIARDRARLQIADGTDPSEIRKQERQEASRQGGDAFSDLAREWWENQKGTWSEGHAFRVWRRFEINANPELDKVAIDRIQPKDIIAMLRKVEDRDAIDIAARTLQDVRRVFRYGVQTGRLKHNPANDLEGVLKARQTQHRPSLQNRELGQFLRELRQYHKRGRYLTQIALELLVMTFSRPGEVYGARWDEFDLTEELWRIPAERMKMKSAHVVPLSRQVLELIEEARPISGQYDLVFPSERDRNASISDNTLRRAMFRMGYDGKTEWKSKATPHGFRANASSILNEKGFNSDAIERQLSHLERNTVRAAYMHHAQFLDQRREMMQWWADFLDSETRGGDSHAIKRSD